MKNKKIIIIIFAIIAVLLIGAGAFYTLQNINPKDKKEEQEKKEPIKVKVDQEAADHEVAKMKSIITPDNKIRIGTTPIYKYDNVCGMTINIIPYENFDKVYLQITMELATENDERIILLENVKKDTPLEYEIQTLKDWSTIKGWSVKIITEQEAIAQGYVRAES